mmetsp:Transcript_3520/g.5616  ORF Transcript_3520/g.5616 Transcript_3520/m.5616 type:complete len:156 (+) Transcript_3520:2-469(+)
MKRRTKLRSHRPPHKPSGLQLQRFQVFVESNASLDMPRAPHLFGAVYLIVTRSPKAFRPNEILLGRRQGTGFMDGCYSLPSGHIEPKETVVEAAVREAEEELGIKVQPWNISVVHCMHRPSFDQGYREYMDIYCHLARCPGLRNGFKAETKWIMR